MSKTEINLEALFNEIVNTRNDLKNAIEALENKTLLKVEALNDEIRKLETDNINLQNKVEYLERFNKKNNIVIFGLRQELEETSVETLCEKLTNLVSVPVNPKHINNFYPLGKSATAPIKIEFVSNLMKTNLLKNCSKLKGTNISISHDLTTTQREKNKILRYHLNQARANNDNCYIRGEKLYINNKIHTVETLNQITENNGNLNKHSSKFNPTGKSYEEENVKTNIVKQAIPTVPRTSNRTRTASSSHKNI